MRKMIDVLENALRGWEDNGFLRSILKVVKEKTGMNEDIFTCGFPEIMLNWRDLREHLMQAQAGVEFDTERFLGGASFQGMSGSNLPVSHNNVLPLALWQWTKWSRRVFQVQEDLQALLRVTSFHKDLLAGDIHLPFPAFLMTLARPIRHVLEDGGTELYDSIFAFTIPQEIVGNADARILGLFMFSTGKSEYRGVGTFDRDAMRKALHRGDYQKVIKKLMGPQQRVDAFSRSDWFTFVRLDNLRELLGNEKKLESEGGGAGIECLRLVLGLACYLRMLPSGSMHQSAWKKPPKSDRPDPRAITNAAEVCMVTSMHALTFEERERFFSESMSTGREASAHFRRGHWRRPPGSGNDPEAEKIILVRPTMVRQDRLKPGEEIAGGTIAVIK